MAKFIICPYFKGISKYKSKHCIKCGDNTFLTYLKEEDRDMKFINVCQGDMESCRTFSYRQLEEMGLSPQSYWDNDRLTFTLKVINKAVDECDNNMFEYIGMQL